MLNKEYISLSFDKYRNELSQVVARVDRKIESSSGEFLRTFLNTQIQKKEQNIFLSIDKYINESIE